MQRRETRVAGPADANVRNVRLTSGGAVTVTLDVDLFSLSPEDQEFILQLVSLVRGYAPQRQSGAAASTAA